MQYNFKKSQRHWYIDTTVQIIMWSLQFGARKFTYSNMGENETKLGEGADLGRAWCYRGQAGSCVSAARCSDAVPSFHCWCSLFCRYEDSRRTSCHTHSPAVQDASCANGQAKKKKNSVALVRERTIPTEWPPLVGEVSANFWGYRVSRGQRNGFPRLYSRISRPEPLLFLKSSSSIVLTRLNWSCSRSTTQKIW
jgi:hypothetical protein